MHFPWYLFGPDHKFFFCFANVPGLNGLGYFFSNFLISEPCPGESDSLLYLCVVILGQVLVGLVFKLFLLVVCTKFKKVLVGKVTFSQLAF